MSREPIEHLVKRMPCPEQLGSFNYSIVVVQHDKRVTAYMGGGTDPRWVMNNGARLPLEEARLHFPTIDNALRQRGWTYATDA